MSYLDKNELQDFSNLLWERIKLHFGSPLVAWESGEMLDDTRIYVYMGSEPDFNEGHWYYFDGSNWADGGAYNAVAVSTDTTLTAAGAAADAKAAGDKITETKTLIDKNSFIKQAAGPLAVINDGMGDMPLQTLEVEAAATKLLHAGKNLLSFTAGTVQSVAITIDGNGVIHLNGTASGNGNYNGLRIFVPEDQEFTLSCAYVGNLPNNTSARLQLLTPNASWSRSIVNSHASNHEETVSFDNVTELDVRIRVQSGFTYNDVKLYPMLTVKGMTSDYEVANVTVYTLDNGVPSSPVAMLEGINSMWTDNGDIALSYYAAPQLIVSGLEDAISDLEGVGTSIFEKPWFNNGRFRTHAHRGLFGSSFGVDYAEESIPAFELAGKKRAWMCEADVRFTSDNKLVCMHDATVDRTTNGSGNVSDMTFAEIRQLKLLNNNGAASDLLVPTLEEFLLICKKYSMVAMIELKSITATGFLQAVIDAVNSCGMQEQTVFGTSVVHVENYEMRSVTDIPIFMICTDEYWTRTLAAAQSNKNMGITYDATNTITAEKIRTAHRSGVPMDVFAVDVVADANAYFDMGMDAITTNVLSESDWYDLT